MPKSKLSSVEKKRRRKYASEVMTMLHKTRVAIDAMHESGRRSIQINIRRDQLELILDGLSMLADTKVSFD